MPPCIMRENNRRVCGGRLADSISQSGDRSWKWKGVSRATSVLVGLHAAVTAHAAWMDMSCHAQVLFSLCAIESEIRLRRFTPRL